jgi:hypothetical protein
MNIPGYRAIVVYSIQSRIIEGKEPEIPEKVLREFSTTSEPAHRPSEYEQPFKNSPPYERTTSCTDQRIQESVSLAHPRGEKGEKAPPAKKTRRKRATSAKP